MLPVAVMTLFRFNDPPGKSNLDLARLLARRLAQPVRRPAAVRRRPDQRRRRVHLDDRRDGARDADRAGPGPLRLPRLGARRTSLIFLPMATPEIVLGASLLTLFVAIGAAAVLPAQLPDDPDRPHHVQHQLRGRHRPGPPVRLRPPPRGGGDGPRGERVDDVLEGDLPDDPARASWPPRCSRSACRSTTT